MSSLGRGGRPQTSSGQTVVVREASHVASLSSMSPLQAPGPQACPPASLALSVQWASQRLRGLPVQAETADSSQRYFPPWASRGVNEATHGCLEKHCVPRGSVLTHGGQTGVAAEQSRAGLEHPTQLGSCAVANAVSPRPAWACVCVLAVEGVCSQDT